jgi:HEAT repeat protein
VTIMRRFWVLVTIRRLVLLIVLLGLGLVAWRVYRVGPEALWLTLKLQYGDVETRRAAAHKFSNELRHSSIFEILGEENLASSLEREDLLFYALLHAARDRDPECRAIALSTVGLLVVFRPTDLRKSQVLNQARVALRDPEAKVRATGLMGLVGLVQTSTALESLKAGLSDPSVEVQETAVRMLGMLGVLAGETESVVIARETQSELALILTEILASQQDVRLRVTAAWAMSYFGKDKSYQNGGCPDVVPALLGALRDPSVEVRRAATTILGRTTPDARGKWVTAWSLRKSTIIPACRQALTDADEEVRDHAAVALFWLGERDPEIITILEEVGLSENSLRGHRFQEALDAWKAESAPALAEDPALGEREGNGPR